MRRLGPLAITATALLSGCSETQMGGTLFYLTPYRLDQVECTELKSRATAAAVRLKQLEDLREKAGASTAGPVINGVVYGPDYSRAQYDRRIYEDEMARRNCDAAAPGQPAKPPDQAAKTPEQSLKLPEQQPARPPQQSAR